MCRVCRAAAFALLARAGAMTSPPFLAHMLLARNTLRRRWDPIATRNRLDVVSALVAIAIVAVTAFNIVSMVLAVACVFACSGAAAVVTSADEIAVDCSLAERRRRREEECRRRRKV